MAELDNYFIEFAKLRLANFGAPEDSRYADQIGRALSAKFDSRDDLKETIKNEQFMDEKTQDQIAAAYNEIYTDIKGPVREAVVAPEMSAAVAAVVPRRGNDYHRLTNEELERVNGEVVADVASWNETSPLKSDAFRAEKETHDNLNKLSETQKIKLSYVLGGGDNDDLDSKLKDLVDPYLNDPQKIDREFAEKVNDYRELAAENELGSKGMKTIPGLDATELPALEQASKDKAR